MKPSRSSSLVLASLALALTACGGTKEAPASAPPAPAPLSPARAEGLAGATPSAAAETPQDDAASGEDAAAPKPPPLTPLGIPECDRFVLKYVACVDLHAPEDQKERLMRELHTHRLRWLELEKMQEGKVAAGLSCRGVAQRLKGDLIVDYGCEF